MSGMNDAWSYDDGDIETNPTATPHLNELVDLRYSRRQTLFGGVSAAATAVFGGLVLAGCDDDGDDGGSANPITVTPGQVAATSSGKMVTLTATASANAQTSSWVQVSGPAVALGAGGDPTTVTFMAPSVASATPLAFRFTASNQEGFSAADTSVTVSPARLDFVATPKSLADQVIVPAGYSVTVLYRMGDPLNAATGAFANNGTDTGFSSRAGDQHDGMSYFGLTATGSAPDPTNSTRGLLVLNHENIVQPYLHPAGATTVAGARPEAEALKEIECHGVSVVEIARTGNNWAYVLGSALNRRVTPNTPMVINGPARGAAFMRTAYSTNGTQARGTINNCANGTMPWNTYLTNEENWSGYFRRDTGDVAARGGSTAKANVSLARYGIGENRAGNYGWATVQSATAGNTLFRRWNITVVAGAAADGTADFRNETNTFGWVVEIDPFNPASVPRKRTALGRMNHEGCWPGRTVVGVKPAFYMGDDAQNEYIYKFVSNAVWAAADATAADRLAVGDKYLDAGTLYVAKFNADGTGQWLPLVFGQGPLTAANATYAFADQADVLLNTRLAADALGATRMDRPEWTAVNPATGEMYCTLTNNSSRTPATTDAANPRAYIDPKLPQGDTVNADPPTTAQATRGNANGHVIRLREAGDTTEATGFAWDIYVFGSGQDLNRDNINLSGLDATNDFSSPDGLWFSRPSNPGGLVSPILWIETDDGAYTDVTNCMLLAAMPGQVGDGTTRTISNMLPSTTAGTVATGSATTRLGALPGSQLRRFLVGPKQCEITGIDSTPDGRSLFVNVQHPGEDVNAAGLANPPSNWPASQTAAAPGVRPRSATIVITKNDGGVVGL